MPKKILILLFILCGCTNYSSAYCSLQENNAQVLIDITSVNDSIDSIHIKESFELPYSYLLDDEKLSMITDQIKSEYAIEENKIVFEYDETLDKTYSFADTIDSLTKERFYCER